MHSSCALPIWTHHRKASPSNESDRPFWIFNTHICRNLSCSSLARYSTFLVFLSDLLLAAKNTRVHPHEAAVEQESCCSRHNSHNVEPLLLAAALRQLFFWDTVREKWPAFIEHTVQQPRTAETGQHKSSSTQKQRSALDRQAHTCLYNHCSRRAIVLHHVPRAVPAAFAQCSFV